MAATVSLLLALRPAPWWQLAGLPKNPGNFVAKLSVDYPICADWTTMENGRARDSRNADLSAHGVYVIAATTAVPIPAGNQVNVGVLLPKMAKVSKVYCATSLAHAAPDECSGERCVPPMSIQLSDNQYTRGRALEVTFANRAAPSTPAVNGRLWILWTPATT